MDMAEAVALAVVPSAAGKIGVKITAHRSREAVREPEPAEDGTQVRTGGGTRYPRAPAGAEAAARLSRREGGREGRRAAHPRRGAQAPGAFWEM